MNKVVLHIGAPKTGSTYLQKHFCKNQDILRSKGIYYPIDPAVSKIAGNAKFLATLLDGTPTLRFQRSFPDLDISNVSPSTAFSALVRDWNQRSETLLLSAENLSYKHAKSIRDLFPDNIECTVIMYVRRQDQWLESYFNQFTKTGLNQSSIDEFVDNVINQKSESLYCPDWYLQFSAWKKHFGNCRVNYYEDAKHNLLNSFYSEAGLELPKTAEPIEKTQVSLNCFQLAYLLEVGSTSPAKEFFRCKTIVGEVDGTNGSVKKYSFLSDTLRRDILSRYKNSNRLLANTVAAANYDYFDCKESKNHISVGEFISSSEYLSYKAECDAVRYLKAS